ncbi:MAG TPA: CvpA family protein [Methylomirabilota bacterium]|nr:CvpA family protein [Methylomirabilota bacterium]
MNNFSFSWVDLLIVGLLGFGIFRGRKRGMSEELLDILKWLCIVAAAGFFYRPAGEFLASVTVFSTLFCYVASYVLIALAVALFFSMIRSAVGAKLIGSDVFGNGEYYLGMASGALRYACMVVAALALLNARQYTAEEIAAAAKYQQENFGDVRFPTLGEFQQTVFNQAFLGRQARTYLSTVLIRRTVPEEKGLGRQNSVVRARERDLSDILR